MDTQQQTTRLRITEIFFSLQGESKTVGIPTIFIRLTGCPLRCQYCDTTYAFQGGQWLTFDEIIRQIKKFKSKYITVTGGEPLAQKNCLSLLSVLCEQGYQVSLETSGALSLSGVDERVIKVMDIKTPASGESDKNRFDNLQYLSPQDQLKFVICHRDDYEWAKAILGQYKMIERCEVLFSPSMGQLEARKLADWVIEDQLAVRFQLQLHKILWDNEAGR